MFGFLSLAEHETQLRLEASRLGQTIQLKRALGEGGMSEELSN